MIDSDGFRPNVGIILANDVGQVLWALGRRDEARRYFDEARRLDPGNRSLERALRETGA